MKFRYLGVLIFIILSVSAVSCGNAADSKMKAQTDSISLKFDNGINSIGEKVDSLINTPPADSE